MEIVAGQKKLWAFLHNYFKIYVIIASMINRFEETIALKSRNIMSQFLLVIFRKLRNI